ncbi:MAG: metalloregulator ArsR/SmtB family transcription factor [Polyangiaceae bacterium]
MVDAHSRDVAIQRAAAMFRTAGDVERLRILASLRDREARVMDLATALDASVFAVARALAALCAARLVVRRPRGALVVYSLADSHVRALLDAVIEHASAGPGAECAAGDG